MSKISEQDALDQMQTLMIWAKTNRRCRKCEGMGLKMPTKRSSM